MVYTTQQKCEKVHMYENVDSIYEKLLAGLNQIHNGETISEEELMKKIDKYIGVYEKINPDEFTKDLELGIESLRELTKDNMW